MSYNISDEARKRIKQGAINSNISRSKKIRDKYEQDLKYCAYCNTKLPFEKRNSKFCNSSCAASYNNTKFIKRQKQGIQYKCLNCNNLTYNNEYCSSKCKVEYIRNNKIQQWLNGDFSNINTRRIKDYLLKIHNNSCILCGWNKINPHTNKLPLELHHIDGNSENNHPSNIQLLCPNCHSLTSTFKGANKNSKRVNRKKYYNKS